MTKDICINKVIIVSRVVFLFIILLICQIILSREIGKIDIPWVALQQEGAKKSDPNLVRLLSFGYVSCVVDGLWMASLADQELGAVQPGTHPLLYYRLDLATELDPAFFEGYFAGGSLLAVARHDGAGARDILIKGTQFAQNELPNYSDKFHNMFWPNPWALPVMLAYTQLFELNDMIHAAEAFRWAAAMPDSASYLTHLAKRLEQPGGEYEVGLKLLNFLVLSAKEDKVRSELERKRLNLFMSQYLFELNRSFQGFLKGQSKSTSDGTFSAHQRDVDWSNFLKRTHPMEQDPWGGKLSLDSSGKVVSTTHHEAVFGLQ